MWIDSHKILKIVGWRRYVPVFGVFSFILGMKLRLASFILLDKRLDLMLSRISGDMVTTYIPEKK